MWLTLILSNMEYRNLKTGKVATIIKSEPMYGVTMHTMSNGDRYSDGALKIEWACNAPAPKPVLKNK
jgi:hypothetical protein